jgi:hypothetical protein
MGPLCHEPTIYPTACRRFFLAECGAHLFTPRHTGQAHNLHQPYHRASGHAETLTLQLTPDFADAIDTVIFVTHPLYFPFQQVVTAGAMAASLRIEATYYNWKSGYGGMEASDIKKIKDLEDENRALKDVIEKKL